MASHADIERWWKDYKCETKDLVSLELNGRSPVKVQDVLVPAAKALEAAIMSTGYRTPMSYTGSYNCRQIGGSTTWSLHSYGVAIDWDYPVNPHLKTSSINPGFGTDTRFELTEANINAVEAIVNADGDSIWRWLGWTIGDTMHFQVDVPPDKCQPVGDTMFTHYEIGSEYKEFEDISWLLFQLAGGTVDPNRNSAQVSSALPWKTNVRLAQVEDFDLIADLTGMSTATRARFKTDGMYKFGKELASLKQAAWRDDS